MYEYVVENLEDICVTVEYVIDRLKNSNVMRKEDLEEGTFSFIDIFSSSMIDEKDIKKGISKLYNNSAKYVSKYNTILKEGYSQITMDGVVFYFNEGLSLEELTPIPLGMSAYGTLKQINEDSAYDLDIDNYMALYKLSEDVMGVTRFKVKDINYLHCFSVSLVDDSVLSLLLVGSATDEDILGLSSIICDRVLLCGGSKTVLCKKVFKEDTECVHRKYFNLFSILTKKVLSVCMPDAIKEDVSLVVKESIVLRDNARIVKGKSYTTPTLVVGVEGEVTVFGDDNNLVKLTRSQ